MMSKSKLLVTALTAFALSAGVALAQGSWASRAFQQPHLAKARAIAGESLGWRHIGLVTCYRDEGQPSQTVNKVPKPTKVFDNLYYFSDGKLGPWALDTSDGIVLIDAMNNQQDVEKYIIGGMRTLGLDPARIKTLIISHGHGDHYGGARFLQDQYGVKVYMSAVDYDLAERSASNPNARAPAPRRDQVLKDGDTLTFGDTKIKIYITPGHTPGSLSMIVPVKDKGQTKMLAYFGGVTNRDISTEMHTAFDKSWGRLEQLVTDAKVDGFIASHPNYDDGVYNLDRMAFRPNNPNPFLVGLDETVRFIRIVKECNLNNIDVEAAQARGEIPKEGGGGGG